MADKLLLAENHKPLCHVVLTTRTVDPVVRFAGEELASYLSRICGGKVRVVRAGRSPRHAVPIFLRLSENPAADFRKDGYDRFVIDLTRSEIHILGENPRSVLFGVYSFLEQLGCRWFYPLDGEQIVPRLHTLAAAVGKKEISHRLNFRNIALLPMIARDLALILQFIDWMAKNHFNGLTTHPANYGNGYDLWSTDIIRFGQVEHVVVPELKKRGIRLFQSSHSLHFFMPQEELLKRYPHACTMRELSAPADGYPSDPLAAHLVRFFEDPVEGKHHYEEPSSTKCWPRWLTEQGTLRIPHQLCYSNRDVTNEYADRILRYLHAHPEVDVIGPWPADGGGLCRCSACRSNPSAIFDVVNRIARRVGESFPRVMVEHLVYGAGTYDIPTNGDHVSDNLIFFLCCPQPVQERWGAWLADIGRPAYRGDYVSADNYACHGMVLFRPAYAYDLVENALASRLSGVSTFLIETSSWWRSCLNLYFLAKASLSKPPKPQTLLKDYCRKYYGARADDALRLYRAVENDLAIPTDLTGYAAYPRRQVETIKAGANALGKLLEHFNDTSPHDPRFARLLRYTKFVHNILSAIMLRVSARAASARSGRTALKKMLAVARLEEQLLELCQESNFAGDGVLDTRFFVSRRWQRFDKDCDLIRKATKNLQ